MRSDRELLQDAVDSIEAVLCTECAEPWGLIEEIRDRLAEPDDEPVAWLAVGNSGFGIRAFIHKENALDHTKNIEPLYRRPPRRPVRLSNTEIRCIVKDVIPDVTAAESVTFRAVARAIEQAIFEKNQ